jgi:hypothetical protein
MSFKDKLKESLTNNKYREHLIYFHGLLLDIEDSFIDTYPNVRVKLNNKYVILENGKKSYNIFEYSYNNFEYSYNNDVFIISKLDSSGRYRINNYGLISTEIPIDQLDKLEEYLIDQFKDDNFLSYFVSCLYCLNQLDVTENENK